MRLLIGLVVSSVISSSALALDLPDKVASIESSLNGSALDSVSKMYGRATAVVLTETATKRALRGAGRDQASSDARVGAVWRTEDDIDAGKVRIVRRRNNRGGTAEFGNPEEYKGKAPAFDDSSLVELATPVVRNAAAEAKLLGANEELKPDSTKFLWHEARQGNAPAGEKYLLAAMVVFRRHIDGVPVVGTRGEATAIFDASDGSLIELSLPRHSYVQTAKWAPSGKKAQLLQSAVSRGGVTPKPGARKVSDKSGTYHAREFRCGYVDDDTSTTLKLGCDIAYASDKGPVSSLVLVEGAARPAARPSEDQPLTPPSP